MNTAVILYRILGLFWGGIPVFLLLLPAHFFDDGPSICLSVLLLGQECFACGLTRATMHLIHFDIEGAYALNKASFVLFPLLVYLWASTLYKIWSLAVPK